MRINTLLFFLLMMISIISCRKDEVSPSSFSFETEVEVVNNYFVGLQGIVKSEDGDLIANATIEVAGQTVQTSSGGTFYLTEIPAKSTGLFIKAEAEGFFPGGTRLLTHKNQDYNVEIILPAFDRQISFMASEGADFYDIHGTRVAIPENGIIDEAGNAYNGNVDMFVRWLDPTASNIEALSPGGLAAIVDDELRVLQSFGMVGVEMRADDGSELNLADGSSAEVHFPLPNELSGEAPDEIDLWHFDEEIGIWTLEGTAIRNGNEYIASVEHFSWWNCDVALNTGILCMTITNERQQPVPFAEIQLSSGQFGTANGVADANGVFCGIIPLNEEMDLTILTPCGTLLHEETIGGFSAQETDLDIVVQYGVLQFENITVSGFVNCSTTGEPVDNGYVVLEIGEKTYVDFTDSNGAYAITFVNCLNEDLTATVSAYDLGELLSGSESFPVGSENVTRNIDACENGSIANFMTLTYLGQDYPLFFCVANVTASEVTIRARDLDNINTVVLGVQGFSEGDHTGNLISFVGGSTNTGTGSLTNITFAQYSEIPGNFISGTFSYDGIEGAFAAEVQ